MTIQQMIDGDDDKDTPGADDEGAPVEIELSDEDLSTADAEAAEAAALAAKETAEKKKQNRVPADKRIGQLTRKLRETEEYSTSMAAELEKERERASKLEREKNLSDKAAFTHYADKVETSYTAAKRAYSDALASGETDKITDAQVELNKWTNEKTEVDRFKARQPKEEPERQQRQPEERQERQQRQAAPDTLADEAKKWTKETEWFNPESDGFNQDMHAEAVQYATVIERRMIRQGRQDEIGRSAEYFKEIEDHVRKEFPDEFDDVIDIAAKGNGKTPNMQAGRPDTAPVTRTNGAISGTPSTKVILTADDNDMVRRYMVQGIIKDPKTGQKITDFAAAQRIYALQKWKTEQEDARRQA